MQQDPLGLAWVKLSVISWPKKRRRSEQLMTTVVRKAVMHCWSQQLYVRLSCTVDLGSLVVVSFHGVDIWKGNVMRNKLCISEQLSVSSLYRPRCASLTLPVSKLYRQINFTLQWTQILSVWLCWQVDFMFDSAVSWASLSLFCSVLEIKCMDVPFCLFLLVLFFGIHSSISCWDLQGQWQTSHCV